MSAKIHKDSFFNLKPELVLQAAEKAGFQPTGEFSQLNSYENRVFDLKLEKPENKSLILKFYRPGRWDQKTIQEEHFFLKELAAEGIPVAAPICDLLNVSEMHVAFFEKVKGKMPEEFLGDDLKKVGRLLARIHNIGARKSFQYRPVLGDSPYSAWESLDLLSDWVSPEMWPRYESAAISLIEKLEASLSQMKFLRIHGDCHRGNLLFNPNFTGGFFFVDFDDCMMGPAVQDFWMLFQDQTDEEQQKILQGYTELRSFDEKEWRLVPLLRSLRIISYSAWIARRWSDPSFPKLFPNFQSYTFWAEETEALERLLWS